MTSPAALITAAEKTWPDLDYRDPAIPRQGMDHHVAVLGDHILRASVTDAYRAQAPTESAVLAELAPLTDTRLPLVLRHTDDWSFTLHPLIPGRALDAAHWGRLPRSERGQLTDQLASLLTALHSRDIAASPYRDVEPWFHGPAPNPAPRALPAKVDLLREQVTELDLDREDRRVIGEILAGMDDLLDRAHHAHRARLVHGDLYPAHLLWSSGHGLGAIDFSDMNLGDPAVDFAHLSDISPELPDEVLARTGLDHDPGILDRAWAYKRWDAVFLLVDHLRTGHTGAATAHSLFDAARHPTRPGAR
ncbi:phosphotransferase family protein [Corynebacterium halotolerans]|uniref:Aminoglycoside phosphotransferase domain-containing protein n=1 Tax=Corynebacterium halotolerans YIM 70093 = DSM 44683 TaxID=1121362 RepID=M1P5H5_9CORY|nr:aminoglycoside phosphotransferase family protein [Corynebacterium halotolerans]AGF71906.1 hypothetical protein A605_04485 [Corynebacterium halotolerans YIM 70093 = DSM 44683]